MKGKFNKVLFVMGILVFTILSLTACSSKAAEKEDAQASVDIENVEGALKGVELTVGTSGLFAPFSYYDKDGTTLIGYDLDFLKELKELLGFTIANNTVQAMDYSALTTSVAGGRLDMALAALCATDERKEVMHFSDIYYSSGLILTVNKDMRTKDIKGIDSLESGNYKVAVEKGTASHLYAQANIPANSIEVHDTITTAYESLEQGKVDALIQDQPGVAFYIKTKSGTKLEMIGEEFNQDQSPYAIAVSFDAVKKNFQLLDILNKAMVVLNENGTMDELKDKWFK